MFLNTPTHFHSLLCLQREDTLVLFSAMLYECVTQECPEMLPTYIAIEQVTHTHTRVVALVLLVTVPTFVLQSLQQVTIRKKMAKK